MYRRTVAAFVCTLGFAQAQQPGQPILIRGGQFPNASGQFYFPQSQTLTTRDDVLKLKPGEVEALLSDDTRIRAVLLADNLELTSAYGKLVFPLTKVKRVEFGLRVSEGEKKEMMAAIEDLTSSDAKKRVTGKDALLAMGLKALPTVQRAIAAGTTGEGGAALADLEARLKGQLPRGQNTILDKDRIEVEGSTFTGMLQGDGLKVKTLAFGDQTLKYDHLRTLRTAFAPADDNIPVTAFPGTLNGYVGQTGKIVKFNITAVAAGGVWGTGTYTLDTYLPAAAIHAGVLKPGETGVVKIQIVASPQMFTGSTQNGITSSQYPYYPNGAYEILK